MMAYDLRGYLEQAWHFVGELWRLAFGVGFLVGVLGVVQLLRQRRVTAAALLLMLVAHAGFFIGYAAGDKDTMYLPAFLVFALFIAVGYQDLFDRIARESEARARRPRGHALPLRAQLAAGVGCALLWNLPRVSLRGDRSARIRGETVLRRLEPGALLLGDWSTAPVAQYLQLVEGRRPDVQIVNRFLISPRNALLLLRREAGRRAVYVDSPLPLLGLELEPAWPLYRVRPATRDPARRSRRSLL
jgi:hypothetical protein